MAEDFVVFRKYTDLDQAKEMTRMLKEQQVLCKLIDNSPEFDLTMSNNTLQNEYQLQVHPEHVKMATALLDEGAEDQLDEIDEDHYLFEFSKEELYDVLIKPDEWSRLDYQLAKKILTERGETISQELLESLRKQRLADLAKPEPNQRAWVVFGYVTALLGGFIAIATGYYLWTLKKTLPDGSKVYAFRENDRRQGSYIFFAGMVFFVVWTLGYYLWETD